MILIKSVKFILTLSLLILSLYLLKLAYSLNTNLSQSNPDAQKLTDVFTKYEAQFSTLNIQTSNIYYKDRADGIQKIKHKKASEIFAWMGGVCFVIAMTLLFRRYRYYLYFNLLIVGVLAALTYTAIEIGVDEFKEYVDVATTITFIIFGIFMGSVVFGFHYLKFQYRKPTPINKDKKRNTNVVIPWLHYTPILGYLILAGFAISLGLFGFEIEIIHALFSDRTPTFISTIGVAACALIYYFFKYKQLIDKSQSLSPTIESFSLQELLSQTPRDSDISARRYLPALQTIACDYNLDDIQFYLSESTSFNVDIYPPYYFDRKTILRLSIPMSDQPDNTYVEVIKQEMASYFGTSRPIKNLVEALSLLFLKIGNFGSLIGDKGAEARRLHGKSTYVEKTTYSDSSTVHKTVEKGNLAGVPAMLIGLLILLPVIVGYGFVALIYLLAFLYNGINAITFKKNKIYNYSQN